MPRATSLAALIEQTFNVKPTLTRGAGGIYDILADGDLIFSKHQEGDRFPDDDEILGPLKERQS